MTPSRVAPFAPLALPAAAAASSRPGRDARYWILAALLAAIALLHVARGLWIGDFWNHAAAVRELSTNPVAPRHPVLGTETAHPFFSPYLLGVAVVGRAFALDGIAALSAAALLNLALLVAALPWFLRALCGPRGDAVAFWFLLFALLLWGVEPWDWSAFVHLGVIGYVLPYPSTFALALGVSCLGLHARFLSGGAATWLLPLPPLLAIVILTHPVTAAVVLVAMAALQVARFRVREAMASGAAVLLGALLATSWPYYDVLDLLLGPGSGQREWHVSGRIFYEDVLVRTFPALAGIPVLFLRWRRDPRDPLALTFVGLLVLYAAGFLLERQGLGRVVSHLALCAQLALATGVVEIEPRLSRPRRAALLAGIALAAALTGNLIAPVQRALRGTPVEKERVEFVASVVGPYDVVLAPIGDSLVLPAVGGKVIASSQPLYWIPDHRERRADVRAFFDAATSPAERERIARRYDARFVLIHPKRAFRDPGLWADLLSKGEVVARSDKRVLIALRINR